MFAKKTQTEVVNVIYKKKLNKFLYATQKSCIRRDIFNSSYEIAPLSIIIHSTIILQIIF